MPDIKKVSGSVCIICTLRPDINAVLTVVIGTVTGTMATFVC